MRISIESNFNTVVKKLGGELVSELIPNKNPPKNADYLFRTPPLIAELKCIERDAFSPDYDKKVQSLFKSWISRGLILVYGTANVHIKDLPVQCQREWLRILEAPLKKNVVADANTQIKETKRTLGLTDAQGLLLIANEGNYSLQPNDVVILLGNILQKKKGDGSPLYSNINWLIYFSANVPIHVPELGASMPFWISTRRGNQDDAPVQTFIEELRKGWMSHCAELRGTEITQAVELKPESLAIVHFVHPLIGKFYTNRLGMKYKCLDIQGDLISWILLDSHQKDGHTIDAEFTQSMTYAGNYTLLTDAQEINRLERRYRLLIDKRS
jgi:hypothetical protein